MAGSSSGASTAARSETFPSWESACEVSPDLTSDHAVLTTVRASSTVVKTYTRLHNEAIESARAGPRCQPLVHQLAYRVKRADALALGTSDEQHRGIRRIPDPLDP
jgi:hypothetical protein